MNLMEKLAKKELKELLIKGWITHDAMWFYHCLQECGIEKTNRINRAAVRSMAVIEGKRIKKAGGAGDIRSFDDLKGLVMDGYSIINAGFMDFHLGFPANNRMRAEMRGCFAYDGIKKRGAIDGYECGIFDRIYGWFDGLGIKYDVSPDVKACMMHTDGTFFRDFHFYF